MVNGETLKLKVTVKNKLTGDVIDCSTASQIFISVYHDGVKVLADYAKTSPPAGFGTIDVTSAATGILYVYLSQAQTLAGIKNKTVKLEGWVIWNDVAYPGGKKVKIDTNVSIELVETSVLAGRVTV